MNSLEDNGTSEQSAAAQRSTPVRADEYANDRMDSPHLAPKLVIEKPITPNLTLSLRAEAQQAKIQRWYDVSLDTLNRVGFKSVDFLPDGIAKLLDKAGNEIFHSSVKLTDEFDGLPMLLAQIEKTWWQTAASGEFWPSVCNLMIRSGVPSFKQITPAHHVLTRIFWLEACCFWMAYLAKLRVDAGEQDWSDLALGSALIPKFVDFYNESPNRGPEIQEPIYNVDRNKLYAFLDAVRRASTNDEKKKALESLASVLFGGLSGFEVFPNRITATGEIDRWVRNSCTYPTISLLGTPILVECKHWQQAVGTDPVGAFIADLEDARLNSGFLLCRKSVSGPAIRRIQNYYQRTKGYVLVFSEDEVQNVCDGESLARMIVEKVESIVLPKP